MKVRRMREGWMARSSASEERARSAPVHGLRHRSGGIGNATRFAFTILAPFALASSPRAQSICLESPIPSQLFYAGPQAVVGDLNGDGRPDIVIALGSSLDIEVLLNMGDGAFAPGSYLASSFFEPTALAIGDMDGDGHPDIVVTTSGSSSLSGGLSVLLNHGDGTFSSPVEHQANSESGVALADLDGDGHLDVVAIDGHNNQVAVWFNQGNGSLVSSAAYSMGPNLSSVAIGDVNGDGHPDLIATNNQSSGTVSVLLNDGHGFFFTTLASYGVGAHPRSVAIGDLNGDGHPELVTANNGSNTVSVLRNSGTGTFAAALSYGVDSGPISVAISDLNGDGHPDLVCANLTFSQDTVSVLFNPGDGTLAFVSQVPYTTGAGSASLAVGDLNEDGHPDLVVLGDSLLLLLNRGNGSFASVQYGAGSTPQSVAIGDLDGDGLADLVVADYGSNTVSVLRNQGDGAFPARVSYPTAVGPNSAAVADLDGDGHLDIVVANSSSNTVSVLLNQGSGTFASQVQYAVGQIPASVEVADLNGDGVPDIVTANQLNGTVSVLMNQGNGTFAAQAQYGAGGFPTAVAIGDLNGDGKRDLVVTNDSTGNVSVLLNLGNGTFASQALYTVGSSPASVAIGDLDGDGLPDLAVANFGSNSISILKNLGNGTFATQVTYATRAGPDSLAIADLDGDGHPDLVVTNAPRNSVQVLQNAGNGTFGGVLWCDTAGGPVSVAIGDLDGDGDPDVCVANRVANTVSVIRNCKLNGNPFCRGDGSIAPCPCGNSGTTGHGCQNSVGTGGAILSAVGSARLSQDGLRFTCSNELPTAFSVLLQGTVAISPAHYGDGLRCVGGTLKRLYKRSASGGVVVVPQTQSGDRSVSAQSAADGDTIPAGAMRYYQVFYRDPSATFCPSPLGSTFNVSNGLAVLWEP